MQNCTNMKANYLQNTSHTCSMNKPLGDFEKIKLREGEKIMRQRNDRTHINFQNFIKIMRIFLTIENFRENI